jgi:hypothetical protein
MINFMPKTIQKEIGNFQNYAHGEICTSSQAQPHASLCVLLRQVYQRKDPPIGKRFCIPTPQLWITCQKLWINDRFLWKTAWKIHPNQQHPVEKPEKKAGYPPPAVDKAWKEHAFLPKTSPSAAEKDGETWRNLWINADYLWRNVEKPVKSAAFGRHSGFHLWITG